MLEKNDYYFFIILSTQMNRAYLMVGAAAAFWRPVMLKPKSIDVKTKPYEVKVPLTANFEYLAEIDFFNITGDEFDKNNKK